MSTFFEHTIEGTTSPQARWDVGLLCDHSSAWSHPELQLSTAAAGCSVRAGRNWPRCLHLQDQLRTEGALDVGRAKF